MNFDMKKPCPCCPFRSDVPPYLTRARVIEICNSLEEGHNTFPCHRTTRFDDDEAESDHLDYRMKGCESHCAGALIMREKMNRPSQMMRIAERLGLYDRTQLDMNAPVFESPEKMARAQER